MSVFNQIIKRKLCLAMILASFLFLANGSSYEAKANDGFFSSIAEMPDFSEELSKEKFFEGSKEYINEPTGDKYLKYSIQLPEGWTVSDVKPMTDSLLDNKQKKADEKDKKKLSRRVLGKVAKFFGPIQFDYISYFEVKALSLNYQIAARNWFLDYAISNGYVLQHFEEVSPSRVEALYGLVDDRGDSFIVRTVAEINGPRVILASYYLPDSRWEKERAEQQHMTKSFTLLNSETVKLESTKEFQYLDLLKFEYPKNWILSAPNIYSDEGMDVRLLNSDKNGILLGEIYLSILSTQSDTTLAEEVAYLKKKMKDKGFEIGNLIEVKDKYVFPPHVNFNRVEVYFAENVNNNQEGYENWLAVLAEDQYYYIVSLLTKSRKNNFFTWSRNIEAFEIVATSVRPQD